ncbi:hypothetical protein DFH08DRAFT_934483 [Mycena albidolilacea]|uniref:Uncharacterized protein n=1 Tax=Mycena albidolilacea TaxID=1033008 RepID=A0AAD7ABJ9_9AGAR|nr:hypothetical protein DFH08DRAFT_934483 [Mycena albidolilacea]
MHYFCLPSSPSSHMLPTSRSEASGLAGHKRKAADWDDNSEHLMFQVFSRLRQEALFSAVEEDEWDGMTARVLNDPKLRTPKVTLSPFTEALPFFRELCDYTDQSIDIREDDAPLEDKYEAVAADLEENVLWKGLRDHVVMEKEVSSRTVIDMIVLTAVGLAQQQISQQPDVDDALRLRHNPEAPPRHEQDGAELNSWVVVRQEVDIPDQLVRSGLAFHGILDYLLAVIPARKVAHRSARWGPRQGFLTGSELYGSPAGSVNHIRKSLAAILEAKAKVPMDSIKAMAQIAAQGAALCVFTQRPSVINTLSDGVRWRFFCVEKADEVSPSQRPIASSSTSGPKTSSSRNAAPGNDRRSSLRSASKSQPRKPFKISGTRMLNIFESKRDLAIVLRLLTLSILADAEEFTRLASGIDP